MNSLFLHVSFLSKNKAHNIYYNFSYKHLTGSLFKHVCKLKVLNNTSLFILLDLHFFILYSFKVNSSEQLINISYAYG